MTQEASDDTDRALAREALVAWRSWCVEHGHSGWLTLNPIDVIGVL